MPNRTNLTTDRLPSTTFAPPSSDPTRPERLPRPGQKAVDSVPKDLRERCRRAGSTSRPAVRSVRGKTPPESWAAALLYAIEILFDFAPCQPQHDWAAVRTDG